MYRRHPKADTHGPKHPASAYVLFANDVREKLGDTQLSFTQISQRIGKSWQLFGSGEPSEWKVQAAKSKGIYLQDLEEYKKTEEYSEYQRYLVDFKLKRKSSSGVNKGPSLQPLFQRSSHASIDGEDNRKASRRVETWLQSSPSVCISPKSKKYTSPYIVRLQSLKDEVIDSTKRSIPGSFDGPYKESNTPPRLLPVKIPRVSLCEIDQKQQDNTVESSDRREVNAMPQVQQPWSILSPSYSHSGRLMSAASAPGTVADWNWSAIGKGNEQGSRQEHQQEPHQRRGGYFETVLQSTETRPELRQRP